MPDADGLSLIIVGPGRAGGSLALACLAAGHNISGVLSRSGTEAYGPSLKWGRDLPEADIAIIATKDDAIPEVVARLDTHLDAVGVVAHVSGFLPVTVLAPIADQAAVGGFHPLQSLPDAERGSAALAGSYAGIGGDPLAVDVLTHLAFSLAMVPFTLDDASRPAYHAAAAAAANFVVASLALSSDLLESAGIDPAVVRPLTERVVANVFEAGAGAALTGPIARGDIDTVIGHLTAARDVSDSVGRQFQLMAEATALRAGREEDLRRWK